MQVTIDNKLPGVYEVTTDRSRTTADGFHELCEMLAAKFGEYGTTVIEHEAKEVCRPRR